jgi:sulfite exporter TauE/SafE
MSGALDIAAVCLLGLAASGHCLLMCGGITAALGIATAKNASGRPRTTLLLAYQFGRISSYALAGLLLGGVFGNLIALLDVELVRRALRIASALVFLLAGLVALGRLRDPCARFGRLLWPALAPLGRRLLPIDNLGRAFLFGTIWGWMPCGFVYTVLLMSAVQVDPLYGAATMAAFGLGTLPAMFAASLGAQRMIRWLEKSAAKYAAAGMLLLSAALTLGGPWLVQAAPILHPNLPFDCTTQDLPASP